MIFISLNIVSEKWTKNYAILDFSQDTHYLQFLENLPSSIRVQSVNSVQLLLPVGANIPCVPGSSLLPAQAHVADDGGGPHEVLW